MARVTGNLRASFLVVLLAMVFAGSVNPTEAQACANGFQCLSCSQAQLCVGGTPMGAPITCPTGFYCINSALFGCSYGTCPTTTTTTTTTTTPAPGFVCSSEGIFPDPLNPNNFYLCALDPTSSTGLRPISFACPTGSTFSSALKQCVLITTTTTTTTAATTTTTPTTTTVATTTTTAAPVFTCPSSGLFPDPKSCSNYYVCVIKLGGGFYVTKNTCPIGTLFSPTIKLCVLSVLSGCTVTA